MDHVPLAERGDIRQFDTLLTREDLRGGGGAEGGLLLRGGGFRREVAEVDAAGRRLQMGGDFGFVGGGDVWSGFACRADGAQRVAVRDGAFLFRVNRQNCPVFRSFQLRNGFVCNQFDEEVVFLDGLADLDLPRADGRLVHVFV